MEQTLTLLTSEISSCNLSGLNVKNPVENGRCIGGKDSGPIYGDLEQTSKYILEDQDAVFYTNEEKF